MLGDRVLTGRKIGPGIPPPCYVQVYDMTTNDITLLGTINVPDLESPQGLIADGRFVYITDYHYGIRKVDMSDTSQQTSWQTPYECQESSPSFNNVGNLILTCFSYRTIMEYTTTGTLVREIPLPSSLGRPFAVGQLTTGYYVVATRFPHDVVILEVTGSEASVVLSYNDAQPVGPLIQPFDLYVLNNDYMLLADLHQIVLLNPTLSEGQVLPLGIDPAEDFILSSVTADETLCLLYVGGSHLLAADIS